MTGPAMTGPAMTGTARPGAKAADALRTIGELAAETGIATHILRYWERTVPALKPLRRSGGRRYYRAEDVAIVRRLHTLVTIDGYTLDGAARALRGSVGHTPADSDAGAPASSPTDATYNGISVDRLRALRDRLQNALRL